MKKHEEINRNQFLPEIYQQSPGILWIFPGAIKELVTVGLNVVTPSRMVPE